VLCFMTTRFADKKITNGFNASLAKAIVAMGTWGFGEDGTLPGITLQATCLEVDCVVTLVVRRVAAVLRFEWVVV